MMRRLVIAALVAAALVVAGAVGAVALFRAYPVRMSLFAAMTRNYLRSLSAPKGATTTELNPAYKGAAPATPSPLSAAANAAGGDWPSYNRTLTSERYAPLAEINANTVGRRPGVVRRRRRQLLRPRRRDRGEAVGPEDRRRDWRRRHRL